MRAEVGRKLNAMKQDLFALGDECSTQEQQRGFLLDVVMKFQDIVSQVMTTSYCMHALFEKDEDFRLATQIRNAWTLSSLIWTSMALNISLIPERSMQSVVRVKMTRMRMGMMATMKFLSAKTRMCQKTAPLMTFCKNKTL